MKKSNKIKIISITVSTNSGIVYGLGKDGKVYYWKEGYWYLDKS